MIYASDLDQTLIYSLRSGRIDHIDTNMTSAERIEEQVTSYISNRTLSDLLAISAKLTFVPVTTRTIAQYRRIHIFQNDIQPEYAVTSNGGNILINGEPDEEWNLSIQREVKTSSAPPEDVQAWFEQIANPQWVMKGSLCDGLFYSYLVHRDLIPEEPMMELVAKLQASGWSTSIQGRKVYLVPTGVNKRDAVAHLKERLGKQFVIASGDSLLDQCLLDFADQAIAPRHGELFRQEEKMASSKYTFTENSGIFAADEIVQYVHNILHAHANK
ncbi:Sucrose-6F-phosphate phosphohydrolase [compost metagenome]